MVLFRGLARGVSFDLAWRSGCYEISLTVFKDSSNVYRFVPAKSVLNRRE